MQDTQDTTPALLSAIEHLNRRLDATLFDAEDATAIRCLLSHIAAQAQEVERLTEERDDCAKGVRRQADLKWEARRRAAELEERVRGLTEALSGMVRVYVALADSGDAGFWDHEHVAEVKAARAALSPSPAPAQEAGTLAGELAQALDGMMSHASIAWAAPEDVDGEDHQRESVARTALDKARAAGLLPATSPQGADHDR